jgi:hypothetical protein
VVFVMGVRTSVGSGRLRSRSSLLCRIATVGARPATVVDVHESDGPHRKSHDRGDHHAHGEEQRIGHYRELLPASSKAPSARIEGTQSPTNKPCSRDPLNHSETLSRKEAPAATQNSNLPFSSLVTLIHLLRVSLVHEQDNRYRVSPF